MTWRELLSGIQGLLWRPGIKHLSVLMVNLLWLTTLIQYTTTLLLSGANDHGPCFPGKATLLRFAAGTFQ